MTRQEYDEGLAVVRHFLPRHPLLPLIERNCTPVSCAYLSQALREVPREEKKETPEHSDDPQYNALIDKLKKLYDDRKALSNNFHRMAHVKDRAENSKRIESVQDDIERLLLTIDHYERYERLPLEMSPVELPTDPAKLVVFYQQSMQSRSRLRRELKHLAKEPKKNAAKIRAKQAKEKEYDLKVEHARKAIKTTV